MLETHLLQQAVATRYNCKGKTLLYLYICRALNVASILLKRFSSSIYRQVFHICFSTVIYRCASNSLDRHLIWASLACDVTKDGVMEQLAMLASVPSQFMA